METLSCLWPSQNILTLRDPMLVPMFQKYLVTLKFMFSKKAIKIDEIFTVDLAICSKCQIDGEDFVNFLWPS